ncbi:MAG: hypothetical protein Q8R36_03510 [bacterium]|nr:hypothetical protein [bacterium]
MKKWTELEENEAIREQWIKLLPKNQEMRAVEPVTTDGGWHTSTLCKEEYRVEDADGVIFYRFRGKGERGHGTMLHMIGRRSSGLNHFAGTLAFWLATH